MLSCKGSLHILDTNPLLYTQFAKLLPIVYVPFNFFLFPFLIVSFKAQNF